MRPLALAKVVHKFGFAKPDEYAHSLYAYLSLKIPLCSQSF